MPGRSDASRTSLASGKRYGFLRLRFRYFEKDRMRVFLHRNAGFGYRAVVSRAIAARSPAPLAGMGHEGVPLSKPRSPAVP
ncbi:MAG: hypothetical protein M3S32_05015 [Acidobacteriota bacterium]|nr:hypothetical protein [Acidobacteriota bacterium]